MRAASVDAQEAEPGDRFGRFEILARLASGGMGRVYLARARGPAGFEKTVALKTIHPDLAARADFVEMFLDEARIAARLDHPNVCRVFDFGEAEGTYFIAMEYLVGEPLSRLVSAIGAGDADGPRAAHTDAAFVRIVADACEGLHAAHELHGDDGELLGVVHRDVSPHNVFVCYDGGVRIVDFGVASSAGSHKTGAELKGKIAYMAPEQVERAALDRRVDVWALGVVLWEALTGIALWPMRTEVELLLMISRDPVQPILSVRPDVHPELAAIVMKALERDRERRWASARELGQALQRWLVARGEVVALAEIAQLMATTFPGGKVQKLAVLDRMKLASASSGERSLSGPRGRSLSSGGAARTSAPVLDPAGETRASVPSAIAPPRSSTPAPAASAATYVGGGASAGTFVGSLDVQTTGPIARPVLGAAVARAPASDSIALEPEDILEPDTLQPPERLEAPTPVVAPFAPPPIQVVPDAEIVRARRGGVWRTRAPWLGALVVVLGLAGAGVWASGRFGGSEPEMTATPLDTRVTVLPATPEVTMVPAGMPAVTVPATPAVAVAPPPVVPPTVTPPAVMPPPPPPAMVWTTPDPTPGEATARDPSGGRPTRRTPTTSPPDEAPSARTSVPAPTRTGPGTVVVTTDGGWAEVFVDGTSRGSTEGGAARIELPAGHHSIELRPFGLRAPGAGLRRSVELEAGETERVRVSLEE